MHWYTGNTYKIRFLGVNDDAFVCMEIFRYALKVIKSRVKTMRGIFYESGKDFNYNDKLVYCHGVEDAAPSTRPNMSRKNSMLYGIGYTDGKAFQNAGDKERLHS